MLDILRGVAILGMFIVHFVLISPAGSGGGAIGASIHSGIWWLLRDKAATMFAILFGVGFAIQLRRAESRVEDVRWRFLRRLLGVAAFGVLTVVLSGASDLTRYAYAGGWLLLVRRWSTRALVAVLLFTAVLLGVWNVALGSYQWATLGVESANAVYHSERPVSPARAAAQQEFQDAKRGTSFSRLAAARIHDRIYLPLVTMFGDWPRGRPGLLLLTLCNGTLMWFLIGLLAVRLGIFDRPLEQRGVLVAAMAIGAGFALLDKLDLYQMLWPESWVVPAARVARGGQLMLRHFGLDGDGSSLALTYIAAITMLVSRSKAWARKLGAIFGAAGRMALTNYILQFAVMSLIFDNYALGVTWLTPQLAPIAAVFLFTALAWFSRWWLLRFSQGPAEWLLRMLTYARLQPLRRPASRELSGLGS